MKSNCPEKSRLVHEYEVATASFAEAVKELHRRMGTSAREDYARLDRAANERRLKSEQARVLSVLYARETATLS
jgi:hypothetical protein